MKLLSRSISTLCVFRGKDTPKESLCFSGRPPTVFIARKVQLLIYEQQVGVLPSPQWSQEFVSVFYGAFIVFILSQIPLKRKMRAPGCPVQTRICRNSLEYTSPLPLGILPVWVPEPLMSLGGHMIFPVCAFQMARLTAEGLLSPPERSLKDINGNMTIPTSLHGDIWLPTAHLTTTDLRAHYMFLWGDLGVHKTPRDLFKDTLDSFMVAVGGI